MMYLRHEAGQRVHLCVQAACQARMEADVLGRFRRPYRDNYRPAPFSRDYVRHLPGWYAQKHPDEDFAETFAVLADAALETGASGIAFGARWPSCNT